MSLPHISNVAAALIHINDPLISEKLTISYPVGMCQRFSVRLGCLTIPLHLVCVCLCVCESMQCCYLSGTSSSLNTDLVGTINPHGDHSLVLMRQNFIYEVLVKVRGKVCIGVKIR